VRTKELACALVGLFVVWVLSVGCVLAPRPATPTPGEPALGATRVREKDGAVMVYVPSGWFLMGSSDDDWAAEDDEKPQHRVWLDGYWIDRTEVTYTQFRQFIEDGGYSRREYWTDEGWAWKEGEGRTQPGFWDAPEFNKPDHPVGGVAWHEAAAYARWAGARLPTEAEWEKAARGTDGRRLPWGNERDPSRANTRESGLGGAAPVGSFPEGASPYGALDIVGNVWEWVADRYDENYYSHSLERNPQGPDGGGYPVVRGGSWLGFWDRARSANRSYSRPPPLGSSYHIGFRLVLPISR